MLYTIGPIYNALNIVVKKELWHFLAFCKFDCVISSAEKQLSSVCQK